MTASRKLWGPPSLLFYGHQASFPGVKQPEREVNHSPASNTEVMNEWSYTVSPPICLHGVNWDNSFLYFVFCCLLTLTLHDPYPLNPT